LLLFSIKIMVSQLNEDLWRKADLSRMVTDHLKAAKTIIEQIAPGDERFISTLESMIQVSVVFEDDIRDAIKHTVECIQEVSPDVL